jgi:hypothetical protein
VGQRPLAQTTREAKLLLVLQTDNAPRVRDIGHDGKPRCAWVGAGDTALGRYHDEVWGTRTHDESAMFEALTLGVFQVGLSWAIVFAKRAAFREAFWLGEFAG